MAKSTEIQFIGDITVAPLRADGMVSFTVTKAESKFNKDGSDSVLVAKSYKCFVHGKLCEIVEKHCHEGKQVAVKGRLFSESGEVRVDDMLLLAGKQDKR